MTQYDPLIFVWDQLAITTGKTVRFVATGSTKMVSRPAQLRATSVTIAKIGTTLPTCAKLTPINSRVEAHPAKEVVVKEDHHVEAKPMPFNLKTTTDRATMNRLDLVKMNRVTLFSRRSRAVSLV